MSIARPLFAISIVPYRLGTSRGQAVVSFQQVSCGFPPAVRQTAQSTGWNRILDRTRRRAEARRAISRYISF